MAGGSGGGGASLGRRDALSGNPVVLRVCSYGARPILERDHGEHGDGRNDCGPVAWLPAFTRWGGAPPWILLWR